MQTSESIVNIVNALVKMQPEFGTVAHSGHNEFDHYSYAKLEDYIKHIRDILIKYGFFIVSSVEWTERLPDRITKKGGTEHAVEIGLTVRLCHESGEWIKINCIGEGQDRADKAVYKAITGARKYAIACLLGLVTSDDPESDEKVGLTPHSEHATDAAAYNGLNIGIKKLTSDAINNMLTAFRNIDGRITSKHILHAVGVKSVKNLTVQDEEKLRYLHAQLAGNERDIEEFVKTVNFEGETK